jgi:hypothetical protein
MVTPDHPLLQLLAVIDMVWAEPEAGPRGRGAPKWYSEKVMFKVYVVSLLKTVWTRRSLWRFLKANPTVAAACGLQRIPHRRTLDRRLEEIAPQAEVQIRALGLVLSVERVTNSAGAASDGSVFETSGPVWHKKDKEAGEVNIHHQRWWLSMAHLEGALLPTLVYSNKRRCRASSCLSLSSCHFT